MTASIIDELKTIRGLEQGANVLLNHLAPRAQEALSAAKLGPSAELRRIAVHMRPEGNYAALAFRDLSGDTDASEPHRSTTAWRYVQSTKRPIHINVNIWSMSDDVGPATRLTEFQPDPPTQAGANTTAHILKGRGVTHLTALPLPGEGGELAGMVTLEMKLRTFGGYPLQGQTNALVELLSEVGPVLARLPARSAPTAQPNPLLPVVGVKMARVRAMLELFSQQDSIMLIQGETGSGKTRIARWCHEQSKRQGKPFRSLSLHGLGKEMAFAQIVGWKKGAFTNAYADTPGELDLAEGGTLVLEDINLMPLEHQPTLLALLDDRKFAPLGDSSNVKLANVRIVATTNERLLGLVRAGKFREDLYYRLNEVAVILPPLRDREDELEGWLQHFLREAKSTPRTNPNVSFSPGALELLRRHRWPGNLRELQAVVSRTLSELALDGDPTATTISDRHVQAVLERDQDGTSPLLAQMEELARLWNQLASDAQARNLSLPVEWAEALAHIVLERAEAQPGGLEAMQDGLNIRNLIGQRNINRKRQQYKKFYDDLVLRLRDLERR